MHKMVIALSPAQVTDLVTDPTIYPFVIDDGSPSRETYRAPEGPVYLGTEDFFAAFMPVSCAVWEVHIGARKSALGISSMLLFECFEEMQRRGAKKILANVPSFNQKAIRCFQRAGMEIEGTRKKSFLKDGILHDQTLLGYP